MKRSRESGIALVAVLLVMMLMSALLVGYFALISADQMSSGVNRDQTQAYAAAHAGLEKLTADLGAMFSAGNFNPTQANLNAVMAQPPVITGFNYIAPDGTSGYQIVPGAVEQRAIPSGPYQGLVGLITPYRVDVIARSLGGAEVEMRREIQTIAVPVFQFGIFSENDLSFFAGPNFAFGGRVHSNQNVYLAQDGNATLTLEDRLTAVGEVVRTHLSNGVPISNSGHRGFVDMARSAGVYRRLGCCAMGGNCASANNEGSVNVVNDTIPPSVPVVDAQGRTVMQLVAPNTENDPTWHDLSVGTYNSYIRNGRTGARRLDLPLVSNGAVPIDIIRRPSAANPDPADVLRQRFFWMASLRILLSDTAADITALPTVTGTAPIELGRLNDAAYRAAVGVVLDRNIPVGESNGYNGDANRPGYLFVAGSPVLTGFLKIERQRLDQTWQDVTAEILNLGFTGRKLADGDNTWGNLDGTNTCGGAGSQPSPNAVVRFQRVRDNPSGAGFRPCGVDAVGTWTTTLRNYIPNVLYDPREGARRDDENTFGAQPAYLAGVMSYVELDVNNLRRWFLGQIGASGANNPMNVTGFVVYFSDRRGNRNFGPNNIPGDGDDRETGEFGWEDFINTDAQSTPNNLLNAGEDVNGNGVLDTYGSRPRIPAVNGVAQVPDAAAPFNATAATLSTTVDTFIARSNPPVFFRRALKLVNGARGQLPANGNQGLTVASENAVYVQGNYNADAGGFGATGDGHVSAGVIADAVTFLSNSFNDIRSFQFPHVSANRDATTTWYRVAIISGKGLNFPHPTNNNTDHTDFGTDGGAHNFIRYIEDWGGQQLNYRGSIVSFYINRQAVGTYKCCNIVYSPPARGYRFDTEFLTPALLPPRTPMFRDVNTLTFRQILRPGQ